MDVGRGHRGSFFKLLLCILSLYTKRNVIKNPENILLLIEAYIY